MRLISTYSYLILISTLLVFTFNVSNCQNMIEDYPDSYWIENAHIRPNPFIEKQVGGVVRDIFEDSKGNMWFSNNGGLYIYDGKILQHLSEKDGLCNNSVNDILEDDKGRIWLATHYNGVCIYDGKSFEHVASNKGVQGTEVWSLYKDTHGNIWFPVEGFGVYRYDGISYKNYSSKHGLKSNAIQSVFEDREGRLWLGGWMGLFRYDGTNFFSVGKSGPWS